MTFAWYKGDPPSDSSLRRGSAVAVRIDPPRRAQLKAVIPLFILIANVIPAPPTLTSQGGSSVTTSADMKVDWQAQWDMEEIRVDGTRAVRFKETGSGRTSAYPQDVRWSVQSTWLAGDAFRPLETEKRITAADGQTLLVERKVFDHKKGTVRLERTRSGHRPETESLDVPADILAIEGLAGILRFANVPKSRALSAHVLTNKPEVFKVTFEWRDEENVKTPAGEFHCYKVEMVPQLGVLNLLRPFIQKTYFWFTVATPHKWVRYQGSEDGPGTPGVVMVLSHEDR